MYGKYIGTTCGGKPFWSVAILCASVFFIILQSCPPGRNHVLFTLLCPRLLRVLFYSRPSGLLNPAVQSWEASQHLSWSWGRSRLELLSWFSVEGADCSPPVNYCTHWEAPCGSISDEWESCQSNAARLGPWGIYEAILFLSIWKAYCDQSAGCVGGTRRNSFPFLSISEMYPKTTQGNLIHLDWQKLISLFLPGKEGILNGKFKFQSLQKPLLILRGASETLLWDIQLLWQGHCGLGGRKKKSGWERNNNFRSCRNMVS